MKLLAFAPVKLALFLILGIVIGDICTINYSVAIAITVIAFLALALVYQWQNTSKSIWFDVLAYLCTIAVGILIITKAQPEQVPSHYSRLGITTQHIWHVKIIEVLKPTAFSQRHIARVKSVDSAYATGKLLLSKTLKDSLSTLQVDDELYAYSSITSPQAPLNPHQFSYKSYLARLGVHHQLKLDSNQYFIKKHASSTLIGIAAKARTHIIEKLELQGFGKEELGVLQALLLGERNAISKNTYDDYKDAGAVHILALSGLHMGIILAIIHFLLSPLSYWRYGKPAQMILTLLLLWGFAFIAGLSPSIIRAATMFSFVAVALHLTRAKNHYNILALSIFFILLAINPHLLFQVGFQMSYAAVLAIATIYPILQKYWSPKYWIIRYAWQLLSVSIAAQLGVVPISLFYFHQFPSLFFISNLLIIPFLTAIIGVGIAVIALSLINLVPSGLVLLYNEMIGYMNTVVAWVAQQENFVIQHISFDAVQLVLSYILIIALTYLLVQQRAKHIVAVLTCLLCLQMYTLYQSYSASQQNEILVLHKSRNSLLLARQGKRANVYTTDSTNLTYILDAIRIGERLGSIQYNALANSYYIYKQPLLRIDSTGIYPPKNKAQTILLTQSPKLNLERLITTLAPLQIIADGSNYKSDIARWKATCDKTKTPFHYTGEKGTYRFTQKD